jgi:hypothetical protein
VELLALEVLFMESEGRLPVGDTRNLRLEFSPIFLKPEFPVPELRLTIPQLAGPVVEILLPLQDGDEHLLGAQFPGH